MNKIITKIDKLFELVLQSYRFFLINLMIEKMKRTVNTIDSRLDYLTERIKILDENKNLIKIKIVNLKREIDAILN
jgi:hypothetical protein